MILGATRPKSYHLQLKFPFNYCISRCRCPNNANVGSKIQGISFFVNKSICRLDDRSFFNRHSCLLRASEWCFRKTPKVKSWLKNYNWKLLFVIVYPNANVQKCKCCVFFKIHTTVTWIYMVRAHGVLLQWSCCSGKNILLLW